MNTMKRGGLLSLFLAVLVAIATLVLLAQGASAQSGECSATSPCPDSSNCCSQYGFCGTSGAYCGTGCKNGPCTGKTPSSPSSPSGGSGWSSFLTETTFDQMFPNRLALYSYANLQTAAKHYAAFGTSRSSDDQKREVAAFLANVNQETGGLQYVREIDQSNNYCDSSNTQYPCAPGQSYFGRGALQLSWNFNYGACGAALNLPILTNPDLVAQNGVYAWQTAVWFWMEGSNSNCHSAILQKSFSGTIKAINGKLECGKTADDTGYKQMMNRVTYYKKFCTTLGVDPGTDLTC